jgi:ribonuclease BN (tRNA processing enzyme)
VDGCVLECRSVPLNHPDGGYGFKLTEAGRSFVFLTDTEIRYRHPGCLEPEEYLGFCHGADLLIHDAQYTEREYLQTRGWGHSTFSDAVDFALSAGVRRLGLYHHDPARDDYALDRLVESARQRIARAGSRLECFACADGMVLRV